MIMYQIKVHEAEKDEDGFWGEFPDLPGCFTQGDSLEELLKHAKEALSLYLEEARDPTWVLPKAKKRKGKQYHWISAHEDVSIALMIRSVRLQKKIGQRQLAKTLGMSVSQLQRLETPGKSNPTVKTLVAISRALNEQLIIKLAA